MHYIPAVYYAIAAIAMLVVQGTVFTRWMYRKIRDDEIARVFVRDMAVNHLPHIYHALRQIATNAGFELEEPPPIGFIELNGGDYKRKKTR